MLKKVTVVEATYTFMDNQLCSGLKALIDGSVNGVQAVWEANSSTKNWGFILVNAKHLFNKINHVGMMWIVRYLWSSRVSFVFKCYCHWSLLVFRNGNGMDSFLHSG